MHGGARGFDTVVWRGTPVNNGVELTYVSRDGEEGYPGTLSIKVQTVSSSLRPVLRLGLASNPRAYFRKPKEIGASIDADDEQLRRGRGYDHNWVLDGANGQLLKGAEVFEPASGRVLQVFTDQP